MADWGRGSTGKGWGEFEEGPSRLPSPCGCSASQLTRWWAFFSPSVSPNHASTHASTHARTTCLDATALAAIDTTGTAEATSALEWIYSRVRIYGNHKVRNGVHFDR